MTSFFSAICILAVLLAGTAAGQYPGAKPVPQKWRKGFESIKIDEARELLGSLAGPDFLGRGPAQPGYSASAGYALSYFRRLGLQPGGPKGSFLQRYKLYEVRVVPETAAMESASGRDRFVFGEDLTFRAPADLDTKAKFVFLRVPKGANASAIDLEYLKDKVVITRSETLVNDRELLGKLGTARINLATPALSGTPLDDAGPTQKVDIPLLPTDPKFTFLRLTESAVKRIAEICGARSYLAESAAGATVETCGEDFMFRAKTTSKEMFETVNVIAKIEGSDPVLKNEAVVIGAHLDHFGAKGEEVSWGADDNASGVTAAMLVAKAIVQNPVKPKRTVVIALWGAEEIGVLGSKYFVNYPTIPLDTVISYLNMDMVGRNEDDPRFNEKPENNTTSVYTGSVKFNSEDLYRLVYETNIHVGLRLKDDHEDRTMRSDTASFYTRNIPTIKIFTGDHKDYHKPTDTADKINYEKLTNIARWVYLTTMELSTRAAKPRFEKKPFVAAPSVTN